MNSKKVIATAIGLSLLGAAGTAAVAQQSSGDATQSAGDTASSQTSSPGSQDLSRQFQQADRNGDGYLSMQEAQSLSQVDQQTFQQADANRDGRLTTQEFNTAMSAQGLQSTPPAQQGAAGAGAEREITVQQQPAQVDVEQQPPEVIVRQEQPEVIIKQPEPNVQITQPEPKVQIEQAQPQVSVQQQGQAQVEIQQDDRAKVDVVQAEDQDNGGQQPSGVWSMTVGDLEGKDVVNANGDAVGEVENVVRGADNEIYAIVPVGGILNIGARDVAISLSELELLQDDRLRLTSNQSAEQLKEEASAHQPREYQVLDSNQSLAGYAGGRDGAAGGQLSFQQLDADGDGYISAREASGKQTLADQWRNVDRNDDGRLDQSEFSAFETQVQ